MLDMEVMEVDIEVTQDTLEATMDESLVEVQSKYFYFHQTRSTFSER